MQSPRRPRAFLAALALGVTLAAAVCVALAPGVALALPEGRVYELVSPPYKGGYGVKTIEAVAPDGESVAFFTDGVFDHGPNGPEHLDYVAQRTAAGWSTTPTMTPAGVLASVTQRDVSSTLASTLALGLPGANVEAAGQDGSEEEFQVHDIGFPDTNEAWALGGMVLQYPNDRPISLSYQGASSDLCHLFFYLSDTKSAQETLLAEGAAADGNSGTTEQLYEVDRGCEGEPPALRLVGVGNHDGPHGEPALLDRGCEAQMGTYEVGLSAVRSLFDAVAAGGGEVSFTEFCKGVVGAGEPQGQLFVRLAGARTLEVSKPLAEACAEVPCAGAGGRAASLFVGASRDGSRVFFTAPLLAGQPPLVAGDPDSSRNLYMASIGCPQGEAQCEVADRKVTSLAEVSHDASAAAEVQGVVRIAPDGSRVYFVARGVLSGANAEGRSPVQGADNLYVYENDERWPSGRVAFIAELCSGGELSGVAPDASCPNTARSDRDLWASGASEAQTAGEGGRFLVFVTFAQLAPGDTDDAGDVYRYDAETEALERVSIGERGADANGNCDEQAGEDRCNARIRPSTATDIRVSDQYEMSSRAVSEDGSRIVFTSAEPLSEDATNGLANAYEWHEEPGGGGSVSLVSSGSASEPVGDVVISQSGGDVFFITSQGLVPQDTDGVADVYDARLEQESGFPAAPGEIEECSGDGCQGPLTNPAPLLVPGSVVQAPGGNLPPVSPAAPTPKRAKRAKRGCAKGSSLRRGVCVKRSKAKAGARTPKRSRTGGAAKRRRTGERRRGGR
jgi:hypothetical protein